MSTIITRPPESMEFDRPPRLKIGAVCVEIFWCPKTKKENQKHTLPPMIDDDCDE